jgi:hypothetical protein
VTIFNSDRQRCRVRGWIRQRERELAQLFDAQSLYHSRSARDLSLFEASLQ